METLPTRRTQKMLTLEVTPQDFDKIDKIFDASLVDVNAPPVCFTIQISEVFNGFDYLFVLVYRKEGRGLVRAVHYYAEQQKRSIYEAIDGIYSNVNGAYVLSSNILTEFSRELVFDFTDSDTAATHSNDLVFTHTTTNSTDRFVLITRINVLVEPAQ